MLRTILVALLLIAGALLFTLWPNEQELEITPQVLAELKELRAKNKFVDQVGIIRPDERARLEPMINSMLDTLIAGLEANPRKSWAMSVLKKTVAEFYLEDTELREPSAEYVAWVIKTLGIKRTNFAFARYMLFL